MPRPDTGASGNRTSSLPNPLDIRLPRHNRERCDSEKQPGLDDPRTHSQVPFQPYRIVDPLELAVEDVVAVVGHIRLACGHPQFRHTAERSQKIGLNLRAESSYLDR